MSKFHKIETVEDLELFLKNYPDSSLVVKTSKGEEKLFKCSVIDQWYSPVNALKRGVWIADKEIALGFDIAQKFPELEQYEKDHYDHEEAIDQEAYLSELTMDKSRDLAFAGWIGLIAMIFAVIWAVLAFFYRNETLETFSIYAMVVCCVAAIFFLYRSQTR